LFFSVINEIEYENILICGRNQAKNGVGVVEHWKRDTNGDGPFVLHGQQVSLPNGPHDFVGSVYIESTGKIFLLDYISKSIFENTWDGVSQIPGSGWALSITPAQVPELENRSYKLSVWKGLTPHRLTLARNWEKVLMHWDPQLGLQVERTGMDLQMREVEICPLSMSEGNSMLTVRGVHGTVAQIVDESGSVIGATVIPHNDSHSSVYLASQLSIGRRYFARMAGANTSPSLFGVACPVRHGYSESLSSGVTLSGMYYPVGYNVGSPAAMSYLAAYKAGLGPPETINGYMAFAFRNQQGQDPVVQVGDNWLLDTAYYINVTGHLNRPNGHMAGSFPIPDDPDLVGAVLLTQFWIQDGETFRLSQIIGATIEGGGALKAPSGGDKKKGLSLDQFKLKTGGDAIVAQILKQRANAKLTPASPVPTR